MRTLPLLSLALILGACTVGPNYAGPPATLSGKPGQTGFVRGGPTASPAAPGVACWWTQLGDPTLDDLETRALAANPDIAVAEARLRQARASLRLERANQAPSANASATYLHARVPGIDLGGSSGSGSATNSSNGASAVDFYNLGFDASWEVDLFGGRRRSVEAARAQAQAAEANVADAQVSLTAEVAQAYVNLRDRQRRIALSRQSAQMQQRMLALTQQRLDRGAASALDVERLRGQVETTNGQIVPLQAEMEGYVDALAVLTGQEPGALDALLATTAPVPLPPAGVAVGDPAALLQRRPDIRAAERTLAQRTAQVGVADAARFPRLNILGLIGLGGTQLSDISPDKLVALAAPMLQWNFLDFGRNRARIEQAEGQRDEAEAQYRAAVLSALKDAEGALSRFGHRRETVASLMRSKASADRAAVLMQQRFGAGTATLIDSLDAERSRVAADQNLSSGIASLTGDYVSLQKALGLGWTAPPPPRR
ncbi:efflux transporter outer membrane subunit [Sphingomonas sp. A2-49]|uniref:efflux transporter outer membrane subunit n=1 Tax=Sphingomonas sp. A2-49 TaxID=1391375 RepID=UPI0021D0879D|nr:efflux transporter outer membrane subunit [Sphingomonas sp. A2-49]MCU6452600.1 efflux transporter outer membrane subunit [Sphingomonas sp. A2-49]